MLEITKFGGETAILSQFIHCNLSAIDGYNDRWSVKIGKKFKKPVRGFRKKINRKKTRCFDEKNQNGGNLWVVCRFPTFPDFIILSSCSSVWKCNIKGWYLYNILEDGIWIWSFTVISKITLQKRLPLLFIPFFV